MKKNFFKENFDENLSETFNENFLNFMNENCFKETFFRENFSGT